MKVCSRFNYTQEKVNWADVIVPTGGDGTFLLASSKIRNSTKPVIGFNSDPNRSEGHLCLPKKYSANISKAVEKLQKVKLKLNC
jgi:NAD+ kinase